MVRRVGSVPKNYDWGPVDALSTLMGTPGTGLPEAELWFGAHPRGECTIDVEGNEVPFGPWLEAGGISLPFLVKFLAAARPLSIQVHPDAIRAREGFEREELDGVPPSSALRTFPDPEPKAELLIALSDTFDLLWGFHTPQKLRDRLERWAGSGMEPEALERWGSLFDLAPRDALAWIFTSPDEVEILVQALTRWSLIDDAKDSGDLSFERAVFRSVCSNFPGDAGIAVASLMHVIRLQRGDGLYVSPGEVHAYVRGFGLEVMTPSDNVIRGGLTTKHRDTDLFMSVAECGPSDSAPRVAVSLAQGRRTYAVDNAPFTVRHITEPATETLSQPGLVAIESAGMTVQSAEGQLSPTAGTAVFADGTSPITFSGTGSVWLVTPGSAD